MPIVYGKSLHLYLREALSDLQSLLKKSLETIFGQTMLFLVGQGSVSLNKSGQYLKSSFS